MDHLNLSSERAPSKLCIQIAIANNNHIISFSVITIVFPMLASPYSIGKAAQSRDNRPWLITYIKLYRASLMARPVHTLYIDLEARTLTSQKFNGFRELVTILHSEVRARLDQVELFRFVVVECMHTFVTISIPRGEPAIEPMDSINLVLNYHTYIIGTT